MKQIIFVLVASSLWGVFSIILLQKRFGFVVAGVVAFLGGIVVGLLSGKI